ncbi:MAG: tyrosine-type recombinase/integrase [Siculibacillus sp.]|nr:tyrosine-type recombinase/integrase [Siculibacillus sp.]
MPKVVAKLNDRQVKAIKADGLHACGEGLYLQIKGSARGWIFRYQTAGKRRDMGLGSTSEVGLKDARDAVEGAKRTIRAGLDPVDARRAERPTIPTFGKFADDLVETLEKGFRNDKHRYQWKQTLGDAYCAAIRGKLVSDITTADVLEVLKPIWQTKQETASRLRGRIEKVLDAAKASGFRSGENPATWRGHLANLLPKRQKLARGHQPALPYDGVPALVIRLRARDAVAARALEFLILTATRAGEVFGATWGEIDTTAKVWTIPANRMKAGKEHRVPLTARALAILAEIAALRTKDGDTTAFVFPGGRAGRPLSNMAFKQLLVRMEETGFVPHGFRSSFRDWCGECTPFPREVAEAALAHMVGDEVERAYRRGDALEKRRKLMDAWAGFVEPKAANVVTLKPRKKSPVA